MRSQTLKLLVAGAVVALTVAVVPIGTAGPAGPHAALTNAVYPLKLSKNRRYLVDQRGTPFMIMGDSPQALIGNLSVKDAAAYIANRRAHGFNALWVNLLCVEYTGCRQDGTTFDGIKPFTTNGDLSTPNPSYFARAEAMIRLAASAGMVVFLDPIETGGWLPVLRRNGIAKDRAYGKFLGRRFRTLPNIVWMSGNDFQNWSTPADDAVVLAVAKGIHTVDHTHLETVELNFVDSGSLDDSRWRTVIRLDAAYTYHATYARVLKEYNRPKFLPVFMVEAGYEFEQNSPSISKGDPEILRRQEYWTALSGSTGQFYGNGYTWPFKSGWKDNIDTKGSEQFGYLKNLLAGRQWFDLVPDKAHRIVTAGYGRFAAMANVGSSDYVTTAVTRNRTLALSYLPAGGKITVDLHRLAKGVKPRWYDPTNGTYVSASGSSVGRSGTTSFTAPRTNSDGDRDWVLVLSRS